MGSSPRSSPPKRCSTPDLRRLGYFVAVAEDRNFTRAAQRLHVAQPALSRQIRLLESELGVELLKRTTHDVELTEAGALLLHRAPQLLADADALWRDVARLATGEQGSLTLAYGSSAGYETAPRLLGVLADRLPDLKVTTRVLPAPEILAGVADGSLDAGIVRCAPPGPQTHLLRHEPQGVLLPRTHPLAASETVALDALAEATLLIHPRTENPGHYDALRAIAPNAAVRERAVAFDLGFTPVQNGEAIAIVGESARPAPGAQLVWRPLAPPVTLDIHLLARALNRSPATTRFLEAAQRIAADLGWL
jgi:DNA-binding transcriptional LysR family regulator